MAIDNLHIICSWPRTRINKAMYSSDLVIKIHTYSNCHYLHIAAEADHPKGTSNKGSSRSKMIRYLIAVTLLLILA